jgi:hypothetical protein
MNNILLRYFSSSFGVPLIPLSQGFCFRTAKDVRKPDELGNGHVVF